MNYSKRHNKFLFPALAGAIYGSSCEDENEISNVVNYRYTGSCCYGIKGSGNVLWQIEP